MIVEPVITFVNTQVNLHENRQWRVTLKVGHSIICPDIIIDFIHKTIDIDWSEIDIAKLTREQFCVLECLLDLDSDIKRMYHYFLFN